MFDTNLSIEVYSFGEDYRFGLFNYTYDFQQGILFFSWKLYFEEQVENLKAKILSPLTLHARGKYS